MPDGITIDTEGNLWVACFNGGKVSTLWSMLRNGVDTHNPDPTSGLPISCVGIEGVESEIVCDKRNITRSIVLVPW